MNEWDGVADTAWRPATSHTYTTNTWVLDRGSLATSTSHGRPTPVTTTSLHRFTRCSQGRQLHAGSVTVSTSMQTNFDIVWHVSHTVQRKLHACVHEPPFARACTYAPASSVQTNTGRSMQLSDVRHLSLQRVFPRAHDMGTRSATPPLA